MQIRINVKGASRKKPAIHQRVEEYPDREMTVEELLWRYSQTASVTRSGKSGCPLRIRAK